MQTNDVITGRVVYVSPKQIILARGASLLKSTDDGQSWAAYGKLPVSLPLCVSMRFALVSRLLRHGVHHLEVDGEEQGLIVANRSTFAISNGRITHLTGLYGSRPLALCRRDNSYYYGEYRSNVDRNKVSVWKWRQGQTEWFPAWIFDNVRHVHGVFHDRFTNALWVTTGDDDAESAIWRTTNNFATLDKVVGGSQQFRAVQLLFTADYVYFGSDTPDERNYIYRMSRDGGRIERMAAVAGSVFYGCRVANCLFFSTAVEPSTVNSGRNAELWWSGDGSTWERLAEFKKDIWPNYFQYGCIHFPNGPGDNHRLYLSPMSVSGHGRTLRIDIEALLGRRI